MNKRLKLAWLILLLSAPKHISAAEENSTSLNLNLNVRPENRAFRRPIFKHRISTGNYHRASYDLSSPEIEKLLNHLSSDLERDMAQWNAKNSIPMQRLLQRRENLKVMRDLNEQGRLSFIILEAKKEDDTLIVHGKLSAYASMYGSNMMIGLDKRFTDQFASPSNSRVRRKGLDSFLQPDAFDVLHHEIDHVARNSYWFDLQLLDHEMKGYTLGRRRMFDAFSSSSGFGVFNFSDPVAAEKKTRRLEKQFLNKLNNLAEKEKMPFADYIPIYAKRVWSLMSEADRDEFIENLPPLHTASRTAQQERLAMRIDGRHSAPGIEYFPSIYTYPPFEAIRRVLIPYSVDRLTSEDIRTIDHQLSILIERHERLKLWFARPQKSAQASRTMQIEPELGEAADAIRYLVDFSYERFSLEELEYLAKRYEVLKPQVDQKIQARASYRRSPQCADHYRNY